MAQPFYLDGLHFSCKRCSRCCTKESGYVYLSKKDLSNILSCLNLTKEEFVDTYCRWVPYYDGSEVLCLLEKSKSFKAIIASTNGLYFLLITLYDGE